ncbi:MAG: glycosyltransferase family 4 protein, partial [Actinomycetota bacterium]|nr:glycosyltransferase family 4 protein [Actinomycetota bacterium]
ARLAWEQVALPVLAKRLAVDLMHSPHYTISLASPVPVVTTLHDATFFSDRRLHLGTKGRFFRTWTRIALRRSVACLVPSAATADQLVRHAGARRSKLMVAPLGVDHRIFAPPEADQVAEVRRHLALGSLEWVAFLGTLEPRKNVPALIRAFSTVCNERAHPPVLLLVGSDGWDTAIAPALAAVPADVRVIRTGHLPVEMLSAVLGGAVIVAYPSLGEGFGLPVLEAMACGAAVLTTRQLSLPEVGGDAVAYSGTEADDIAVALADLLDDPLRRSELSRLAIDRAAQFTWAATAEAHQAAYDRAAAAGRRR